MLINQMGNFSQCICISNHHDVYFKYLTILFVNHASIKLEFKKKIYLRRMYNLCFSKLVLWIFVESHEKKRRKSFMCSTWEKQKKSVDEWKEIWLEARRDALPKGGSNCLRSPGAFPGEKGGTERGLCPFSDPTQPQGNQIKGKQLLAPCTVHRVIGGLHNGRGLLAPEQGKSHRGRRYCLQLQKFHFRSRKERMQAVTRAGWGTSHCSEH